MTPVCYARHVGAILLIILATGCASASNGTPGLSADAPCSAFLQLSPKDQEQTVSRLLTEIKVTSQSPVDAAAVAEHCRQSPNLTLGQSINWDTPIAPHPAATEGFTPSTPDDTAPANFLQDSFTDDVGYSYNWGISDEPLFKVLPDTENALPGKAKLVFRMWANIFVENTTKARNAPVPEMLGWGAAWRPDSPLCRGTEMRADRWHLSTKSGDYCVIRGWGVVSTTPGSPIPKIGIGDSVTKEWSSDPFVIQVPESEADAVERQLQSPEFVVLSRPGGEFKGCLIVKGETAAADSYVTASTAPTGCSKRG